MADGRRFKYMREDFGELPVVLNHLTIHLNFLEDRVEASNLLEMTARNDCEAIELDADDLEMLAVEWRSGLDGAGKAPGSPAHWITITCGTGRNSS